MITNVTSPCVLFGIKLPSQSANLANNFIVSVEHIVWTDNTLHIGWKERTSNKVEMVEANFQLPHSLAHQKFGFCQEGLSGILKIQQHTTDNTSHSIPSWWRSRLCCGEEIWLSELWGLHSINKTPCFCGGRMDLQRVDFLYKDMVGCCIVWLWKPLFSVIIYFFGGSGSYWRQS